MDVFAHTLWTNVLFHLKYRHLRKMRYLAAFFGVAPDLVGFTPVFLYIILTGKIFTSNPEALFSDPHWTFRFAEEMYNYSHSMVIFAAVMLIVLIIGNVYYKQKAGAAYKFWFFWPLLGWPFHILLDIPTHPNFYSTPFLFPLSDYKNHYGVEWSHPVFMIVNYGLLIVAYILLTLYQKRKYGNPALASAESAARK